MGVRSLAWAGDWQTHLGYHFIEPIHGIAGPNPDPHISQGIGLDAVTDLAVVLKLHAHGACAAGIQVLQSLRAKATLVYK